MRGVDMKKFSIAVASMAIIGFGFIENADDPTKGPVTMTDNLMDNIVAGAHELFIEF